METTFERAGGEYPRDDGNGDAGGVRTARATRAQTETPSEWRDLIADVEDLLKKVAHVSDAEVARVRERLQRTLNTVRSSATAGAQRARGYAHDASAATEEYVRESPWTAISVAAAVGVLIGFIASRR